MNKGNALSKCRMGGKPGKKTQQQLTAFSGKKALY